MTHNIFFLQMKGEWVECRVLHRSFKIIRIEQVKKSGFDHASFSLYLHAFIRRMKHILWDIPDLRDVKIGFNQNEKVADFILESARMLALKPQRRWVHVVVYKGEKLIFVGTVSF